MQQGSQALEQAEQPQEGHVGVGVGAAQGQVQPAGSHTGNIWGRDWTQDTNERLPRKKKYTHPNITQKHGGFFINQINAKCSNNLLVSYQFGKVVF